MYSYIGKTCPYCGKVITQYDEAVICNVCGIPHHKNCWITYSGCTTPGCAQNMMEKYSAAQSTVQNAQGYTACSACGTVNAPGVAFCTMCGAAITGQPSKQYYTIAQQQKQEYIAQHGAQPENTEKPKYYTVAQQQKQAYIAQQQQAYAAQQQALAQQYAAQQQALAQQQAENPQQ